MSSFRHSLLTLIASGVLVCFAVVKASAEFHIFIEAKAELLFDQDGRLEAVRNIWQFDEAFTEYAIQGLDISATGLKPLADVNIKALAESKYFTSLKAGSDPIQFLAPKDYWLEYNDKKLTLFFTLPLVNAVAVTSKATVQIFDSEFYVSFHFSNDSVKLVPPPAKCSKDLHTTTDGRNSITVSCENVIASASGTGRRVALVIGNSAYQNVPSLNNPANDATLIVEALKTDGFSVTMADNLDHEAFITALKTFAEEADNANWAVVYFAGHGIEIGGTNYLIPVDAKLRTDRDVGFEAIPIDQVMNAVDGAHQLRVVILDACRNNPFAETMKRSTGVFRAVNRGLARIEPTQGTVIVYSARPGQIAADGDGADSPFAMALADHLTDPGVEVLKLFRLVRDDVLAATGNGQEVFQDSSLPGTDFFFRSK